MVYLENLLTRLQSISVITHVIDLVFCRDLLVHPRLWPFGRENT